jgi:hypothetical protein
MSGDPHSPTTAGPTPPVTADAPATEPNTVAGGVLAAIILKRFGGD